MVRRSSQITYREDDSASDDNDEPVLAKSDSEEEDEEPDTKRRRSSKKAKPGSGKKKGGGRRSGPRRKISPSKTPGSKRKAASDNDDDDDDNDNEEEEDVDDEEEEKPLKAKKFSAPVKRGRSKRLSRSHSSDDEEEEDKDNENEEEDVDDEEEEKPLKAKKSSTPVKRGRSKRLSRSHSSDDEEEDKDNENDNEEEEVEDDEDEEKPLKAKKFSTPFKRGRPKRLSRSHSSEDEEEDKDNENDNEEEDDENGDEADENDDDGDDTKKKSKKKRRRSSIKLSGSAKKTPRKSITTPRFSSEKKKTTSSGELPPVSEMVLNSIRALKDSPRKGSTLGAIKQTIRMNWSVNMDKYDAKIKKYITNALIMGEIIETKKASGFRGRYTIPGLKVHKKKKLPKLTEKFDEDEVEYKPQKTAREIEKEKELEELERRRIERALWKEKQAAEKASRPKKKIAPKKEEWEVLAIQGHKFVRGEHFYLIKYDGPWKPQWEPESNVKGCQDLVDQFLEEEERKLAEKQAKFKEAEEKGIYEVQKIIDVKFKRDKTREFLIRWKGWGQDGDTWEEEKNLDCPDLIEAFMQKVEKIQNVSEKSLRIAPKKVERMAFAHSRRINKRTGGIRVTYVDME